MKVVLFTRNPNQAEQIKAGFEGFPIQILTLGEAGIEGQGVEDGTTLKENALKKAMFVHQKDPSVWALADDTGVFIDALDGKPGVDTADWHGQPAKTDDVDLVTRWILGELKDVKDRCATFETVVAIVSPDGEQYFFDGKVRGKILKSARAATQPKMPYAPIFMPEGTDKVWGEMTVEEENQISHRGKAFRQARDFLETLR